MINPIKLVFCLALFAAVCALEVFLSKRRAWWPGLVLPLCLLPPVLFVLPNVVLNALGVAENSLQKVLSLLMGLLFFWRRRSFCWRFTGTAAAAGNTASRWKR